MQKTITTLLLCFVFTCSFGQKQKILSTYLTLQFSQTLYDIAKPNNPWGIGLGLQTFLNTKTKFKATIELTGDVYLADDKVLRTDINGFEIKSIPAMVNLFVGGSFNPVKFIYLSVVGGPGFINGQTLFGIKPSVGFYFPGSKKWAAKISYLNLFNRDKATKKDFGSLSVAVGLKLF
jgi:hypothetical protein